MKQIFICVSLLFIIIELPAQENLLHIKGAYHYSESTKPGIQVIAVVVEGELNLIGDPDDLTFVDADNDVPTGYAIDDCSFLSPDGEEAWSNLPEGYNKKSVHEIFIVGILKDIKRIKIKSDGTDISDSRTISGTYPSLPPAAKRIKH